MPLNQLYHDYGVAQTRAQHAGTAGLRAEHAAEVLRAHHRIRRRLTGRAQAIMPSTDRFEVFRADEVRVTSTRFVGGDWRWRLVDDAGNTLAEGGGYRSERASLEAVSFLRNRANSAG